MGREGGDVRPRWERVAMHRKASNEAMTRGGKSKDSREIERAANKVTA